MHECSMCGHEEEEELDSFRIQEYKRDLSFKRSTAQCIQIPGLWMPRSSHVNAYCI